MRKVTDVRINIMPLVRQKSIDLYNAPDKLSQKEIADATGIPQGTLSRWMNGKVDSFKGNIVAALMTYFDCEMEDLFTIDIEEAVE